MCAVGADLITPTGDGNEGDAVPTPTPCISDTPRCPGLCAQRDFVHYDMRALTAHVDIHCAYPCTLRASLCTAGLRRSCWLAEGAASGGRHHLLLLPPRVHLRPGERQATLRRRRLRIAEQGPKLRRVASGPHGMYQVTRGPYHSTPNGARNSAGWPSGARIRIRCTLMAVRSSDSLAAPLFRLLFPLR